MLVFEERPPTVSELERVAEAVGWLDHFDWSVIGAGLARSLHGVVAIDGDEVVGVGRLVGDGVRYAYVQDVMVRPDATDEGVATSIVERLLAWVDAQPGDAKVVGLFASPEAVGVYESLGFSRADDDPVGMVRTGG
ncbi:MULTISPECIES: GNAT family N-acetyltransferase [unclassified Agrococcus]|uniref:GNAT family N-acetyltransferase n=1 Tax=unclassified Agrococcus TaxID=2615065 RepID=UPI0036185290